MPMVNAARAGTPSPNGDSQGKRRLKRFPTMLDGLRQGLLQTPVFSRGSK
jgi:hypothetical protein